MDLKLTDPEVVEEAKKLILVSHRLIQLECGQVHRYKFKAEGFDKFIFTDVIGRKHSRERVRLSVGKFIVIKRRELKGERNAD